MFNWYKYILIICLISVGTPEVAYSQGDALKRTRAKLEYIKKADNSVNLQANIKVREDRYVGLEDATVIFYAVGDTTMIELGELRTDVNGDASLVISDIDEIYRDEEGYMNFEIIYDGNDQIAEASDDISVKEANMDLSFFQKDDVKRIHIEMYETGGDDEKSPIVDQEVFFYIKGTFSLLNFATEYTNEEGMIDIEFPVDMPGDTTGLLTIVTKIEESDDYGIMEAQEPINWGVPVVIEEVKQRGLGDTDAPLWMVYTLIILLSAVWFHYFYVMYLILKIKLARTSFT